MKGGNFLKSFAVPLGLAPGHSGADYSHPIDGSVLRADPSSCAPACEFSADAGGFFGDMADLVVGGRPPGYQYFCDLQYGAFRDYHHDTSVSKPKP